MGERSGGDTFPLGIPEPSFQPLKAMVKMPRARDLCSFQEFLIPGVSSEHTKEKGFLSLRDSAHGALPSDWRPQVSSGQKVLK